MSSEKPTVQTLYRMADPATPAHLGRPESAGFDPATDEEILAQPCVVAALKTAREEGVKDGRVTGYYLAQSDLCRPAPDEEILAQPCVVAALAAERERWESALITIRDEVLNERGPMAGEDYGSERVNAVLSIIDDNTPD